MLSARDPQGQTNSRLILVVDDSSALREALVSVLQNSGYEAFGTPDGQTALVYARDHPVALLITDMIMPGQEGVETIQQFVREFPDIPIVAISGNADYLRLAQALGASTVLTKPIGNARLLKAVADLIG